ncbi:hypothetical protein SLEP1_g29011 [Rubroshorea leprosula]|uniref:Transmembrane protein n=1 Tax=Rubroshorea leprosula TaxID=152421 RepID=A0AAV5K532_9ROSI|nr:hypothetical protein SLEP1_g29011 [Rubroshorea leprosula]
MPIASQSLLTNLPPRIALLLNPPLKNPNFSPPITSRHIITGPPFSQNSLHLHISRNSDFKSSQSFFALRVYENDSQSATVKNKDPYEFNLDSFLSAAELLCIVSAAVISVTFAVSYALSGWKSAVLGDIWRRALACGIAGLVGGVAIGALIRRRQWKRIYVDSLKGNGEKMNLVERIEKLEEDLRGSATIIRVLSRQVEKLGIRFRVTRKTLKDPIAETAALAQKNSEATRALAVQIGILERELGENQKVLLAMQDQQQKQLELILAIGKLAKLWESKQEPSEKKETRNLTEEGRQLEIHKSRASDVSKETINDRA